MRKEQEKMETSVEAKMDGCPVVGKAAHKRPKPQSLESPDSLGQGNQSAAAKKREHQRELSKERKVRNNALKSKLTRE